MADGISFVIVYLKHITWIFTNAPVRLNPRIWDENDSQKTISWSWKLVTTAEDSIKGFADVFALLNLSAVSRVKDYLEDDVWTDPVEL
jgi:hypothetical protein